MKFQFFDHKTVILDRKKFIYFGLSAYENLTLYRTMRILSVPIQKCFNFLCTTQITASASAISKILVMKKKHKFSINFFITLFCTAQIVFKILQFVIHCFQREMGFHQIKLKVSYIQPN